MKKKTAAILALMGSLLYLGVSVYLMLKYDVDPEVALEGEYFQTFLLLRLPRILFLFTCVIYFLVAIPQPSATKPTNVAPKPTRIVQYVEEYQDVDENGNVVVSRVVRKTPVSNTTVVSHASSEVATQNVTATKTSSTQSTNTKTSTSKTAPKSKKTVTKKTTAKKQTPVKATPKTEPVVEESASQTDESDQADEE